MAEPEPMIIDCGNESRSKSDGPDQKKKQQKRKRVKPSLDTPSPEEKQAKINALREELESLFKFFKELIAKNRSLLLENAGKIGISSSSLNGVIACLTEESDLPLSLLVDEIYERVKIENGNGIGSFTVSKASIRSTVLMIGQRLHYGMPNPDADLLEDESESALWCWETRDLKLIPKPLRTCLKPNRTCRKKIQERISAVSAMVTALEKSEDNNKCKQELLKTSEKLSKVLNEADIRSLMESMSQKNGAEKIAAKEEKLLIKQMEKAKRETEKEKKRMEREFEKEKLQREKQLKRHQEEAKKEDKQREKEESEIKKQLKRQQEDAEKDQKRKEKEEAEMKERLALKRQASLMERFLKRSKTKSTGQSDHASGGAMASFTSPDGVNKASELVTQMMDVVLSQNNGSDEDIWKSHLKYWHQLGCSIRSNKKMHWGIRQKPKEEPVKELKLTTSKDLTRDDDLNIETLVDRWDNGDGRSSHMNSDSPASSGQKRIRRKQLLQFDKSYRPAFYGIWPRKSQFVGARHPLAKDPELDYEIDSDEEWEEEEPGESLSECDKDDEDESLEEGHLRGDDEDESEDGFFVPDGYLSENEGVQDDVMEPDLVEETRLPTSEQAVSSEEFCALVHQQKHLGKLTENALRKNQPLIVINLMHEKAQLLSSEELTGTEKLEQICLQALSICAFPGCAPIEISVADDVIEEDQEACTSGSKPSTPVPTAADLSDSDLPQIVTIIQSCPHGIGKLVEALQQKFPTVSKYQLRNKVREISEFSDNRWQVKREIHLKLGLSTTPEKSGKKTLSIATFFSKRCLPPSGNTVNPTESSPESSKKSVTAAVSQDSTVKH